MPDIHQAERFADNRHYVNLTTAYCITTPVPRRAVVGAVSLRLLHGCVPGPYRWRLDPTAGAAA